MKWTADEHLCQRCDLAFLEALTETLKLCVARAPLASDEQRQALLEDVTFAVAAHLSGSSHGGRVDEEEVYPMLIYSLGEYGAGAYLLGHSAMHERVPAVARKYAF